MPSLAKRRICSPRSRSEPLGAVVPTAALDTGDRDGDLRLRLDEHGPVEDAVLFRPDELLALIQQDVQVERIGDE
jgi:hypothetical protein